MNCLSLLAIILFSASSNGLPSGSNGYVYNLRSMGLSDSDISTWANTLQVELQRLGYNPGAAGAGASFAPITTPFINRQAMQSASSAQFRNVNGAPTDSSFGARPFFGAPGGIGFNGAPNGANFNGAPNAVDFSGAANGADFNGAPNGAGFNGGSLVRSFEDFGDNNSPQGAGFGAVGVTDGANSTSLADFQNRASTGTAPTSFAGAQGSPIPEWQFAGFQSAAEFEQAVSEAMRARDAAMAQQGAPSQQANPAMQASQAAPTSQASPATTRVAAPATPQDASAVDPASLSSNDPAFIGTDTTTTTGSQGDSASDPAALAGDLTTSTPEDASATEPASSGTQDASATDAPTTTADAASTSQDNFGAAAPSTDAASNVQGDLTTKPSTVTTQVMPDASQDNVAPSTRRYRRAVPAPIVNDVFQSHADLVRQTDAEIESLNDAQLEQAVASALRVRGLEFFL